MLNSKWGSLGSGWLHQTEHLASHSFGRVQNAFDNVTGNHQIEGQLSMRATKKILVVDDNPINLQVLQEILCDEYRVRFAQNGQEAIHLAKKFRPGIVLLDVMMPGMDGLDVCRALRRLPGVEHCVIIMVSAKAMPSEQAAGLNAGADGYITKPFDEVELLQKLREFHDSDGSLAEVTVTDNEPNGDVVTVF